MLIYVSLCFAADDVLLQNAYSYDIFMDPTLFISYLDRIFLGGNYLFHTNKFTRKILVKKSLTQNNDLSRAQLVKRSNFSTTRLQLKSVKNIRKRRKIIEDIWGLTNPSSDIFKIGFSFTQKVCDWLYCVCTGMGFLGYNIYSLLFDFSWFYSVNKIKLWALYFYYDNQYYYFNYLVYKFSTLPFHNLYLFLHLQVVKVL